MRWWALALAPAIVSYIGFQVVGWYVGNFIVKPNELIRERPFIRNNIDPLRTNQRLTAQGKLGEAGQKLEELKRKLDHLNVRSSSK